MEKDHGQIGPRGSDGCGDFHEVLPGPDGFCTVCRPAPDHPALRAAEAWWTAGGRGSIPERATIGWRKMLEAWVEAGRPGL